MNYAITRLMHSRYATIFAVVVMVVCAVYAHMRGLVATPSENSGLAFPVADAWFGSGILSMVLAQCAVLCSCLMLVNMLRVYNFLRAMTLLPATLLAVMLTSMPVLLTKLNSGVVLLVVVLACTMVLFRCFGDRYCMRNVFLIFFVLSGMSAAQHAFLVFIPVFIVGCLQMRVMNMRTICAALMGIITPWWLLLGFGILKPASLHLPQVHNVFASLMPTNMAVLIVFVVLTAFLGIVSWVMSVMKAMSYNAVSRACNGFFAILMLAAMIAMAADYGNITAYIPLLACCSAVQVAHVFCIHFREKSYVGILCIIAVYYLLFVWRVVV